MSRRSYSVIVVILSLFVVVFAQTRTIQIAGVTRKYIVHAPGGLDNPPLVFNIHGYDMDAASEQSYTKMDAVADREKFIVVYPEALNRSWDLSGENDYTFILEIIEKMDDEYHIDRNRIYSCGFSQGGFMTFQLACRYSDIFAAIAPTSGTVSGACNLKRPVPMRLTFGTNEFDRGPEQTAQFMRSVIKWADMLNCPADPEVTRPYPPSNPNSLVTRLYYGPCDGGSEVIGDSVRTGGHEWPMNTGDRVNNSEETWEFLKKFTLENITPVAKLPIHQQDGGFSVSYSNGIVRLQGVSERCPVRVLDTKGRVVMTTTTLRQQFHFANKPFGIYMVVADEKSTKTVVRRLIIH
jgi:poly(3-hydroxybutyrate) depolymerase